MNTKKNIKPSIQKRSFQLFELLISLVLISLCLFPMIKTHALMRKEERKQLEQVLLEKASQDAFCLIKEKLYENKGHSWEELMAGTVGELGLITPRSNGVGAKQVFCNYQIKALDHVNKKNPNREGLIIEVNFDLYVVKQFDKEKNSTDKIKSLDGKPFRVQHMIYLERQGVDAR